MENNQFLSHLRKDALQIFRIINACNRQTFEDVLLKFRRNYVRSQSQATEKHKWHKLIFDPKSKCFSDFQEEPNGCAERFLELLHNK